MVNQGYLISKYDSIKIDASVKKSNRSKIKYCNTNQKSMLKEDRKWLFKQSK